MKWQETYRINSHDIDYNGNVRPSAVIKYLNETANLQMLALGPSNEKLREQGRAFLLSRAAMENPLPLHANDIIEVTSWPVESRLAAFNRCGEIKRNGTVAARIITSWALVNISDRSLLRVADEFDHYGYHEQLELSIPLRFRIPRECVMEEKGVHTVTYSDADLNMHMNNTLYADMFASFLCMNGRRVEKISVNYLSEAALGESLSIEHGFCDGTDYFRASINGHTCTEVAIITTES